MALNGYKLDDRTFQDLVDEAKKRIPHYCKEWTDHNVSDPGVTLIELFAWLTEIILYRLNQVPDNHYVNFMDMLGVQLAEPVPASAPVTFWLAAPQPTPVVIPEGTEVASTQTETEPSIVFTTDDDFVIVPPKLETVFSRVATKDVNRKQYMEHNLRRLEAGFDGVEVFSTVPQVDDAFYFGFENDLSDHILGLDLDCDPAGGAGIDPTLPPYVWESSTGSRDQRWEICEVDSDTTKGMNSEGRILIHLPKMGRYSVNNKNLYWVRVRIKDISSAEEREGVRPYQVTPRFRKMHADSWGGTMPATHAQQVRDEFVGRSEGSAGQRFNLQMTPILARTSDEHLVVQVEGAQPQHWTEVKDFASSTATDRHYTLDSVSGELRFGAAIRQPDGAIKLYGAVPPRGANLIFQKYRYGGGQDGNVEKDILNTLKTGIPYVARVGNRKAAWGGLDAESIESAMTRTPALLRSRDRAVTEADFEFLARQALPGMTGRVKCLQPRPASAGRVAPGQIYVLIIPRVKHPAGYLDPKELELNEEDIKRVGAYLDERRLLTTRLDIRAPAYRWVAAKVICRPSPGVPQADVERELLRRLYRYLNPLTGGADGVGWPFSRELFISDVYQCLQGTPNIQFIRAVEIRPASPGGRGEGQAVEFLEVLEHGVLASGLHEIEFV
jgi:predicted phage baseplate assembly protein